MWLTFAENIRNMTPQEHEVALADLDDLNMHISNCRCEGRGYITIRWWNNDPTKDRHQVCTECTDLVKERDEIQLKINEHEKI